MAAPSHDILVRRGPEVGLVWTILISALMHAVAIGALLVMPRRFLAAAPRLESYTVELVASGTIGGTNLGGRSGAGEKAAEPAAVVPPAPPAPRKQRDSQAEVVAKPAPKPAPKPAAEPAPPAREAKVEPAERTVREPEEKAAAVEPARREKPRERAEAPVRAPSASKAARPTARPPEAEKPRPAATAAPEAAEKERPGGAGQAHQRDEQIATAIQRRADEHIAAAVRRRAEQLGDGGRSATGGAGDGGPIAYGPGSGAGGSVMGAEYILYRSRMERRIREAWAWAGADRSLRAVIRFGITAAGEIVDIQTIKSSGDLAYDTSAERAVRAASPLGPVPERYRHEFATVELTFRPDDIEP